MEWDITFFSHLMPSRGVGLLFPYSPENIIGPTFLEGFLKKEDYVIAWMKMIKRIGNCQYDFWIGRQKTLSV